MIPDIYAFKPETEDWVRLGELTRGRYVGHGIAISNNEILVIGQDIAEICKLDNENAACEGNDLKSFNESVLKLVTIYKEPLTYQL